MDSKGEVGDTIAELDKNRRGLTAGDVRGVKNCRALIMPRIVSPDGFGVRVSASISRRNCRVCIAKGDGEYDGVSTRRGRSKGRAERCMACPRHIAVRGLLDMIDRAEAWSRHREKTENKH